MFQKLTSVLLVLFLSLSLEAQTVYVSSTYGDDFRGGATKQEAVRTIRRARELGSDIKLREGDVFYEYLRGSGFSLSSYADGPGEGDKPVISGFRIIPVKTAERLWECGSFDSEGTWGADPEGHIYRLDLMAGFFKGYTNTVRENDHKNIHNVGAIYIPADRTVHGRKCQCSDSLAFESLTQKKTNSPYKYMYMDYDFYQTGGDYRYLYVYATSRNLLTDKELWLSMGADAIRGTDYSVDGIKFYGWGKTAVRGGSNIRVTNCDFDIIGGSTHEYEPYWIRFGNGVEFWADQAVNDEVSNCRFERVFDTAMTIQGPMSRAKGSRCENIHFHDNIVVGCRQDFEVWINSADGLVPTDCSFTNNVGYDSGDNGFSTEEYNNTHLLHYILSPYRIEGIRIENNVFHRGMGLYYANSAMDNLAIGSNEYHCEPGAPVVHGLYGKLSINAPIKVRGGWKFAEGITPEGEILYSKTRKLPEALRRFESFINELTGGSGFRLVLD